MQHSPIRCGGSADRQNKGTGTTSSHVSTVQGRLHQPCFVELWREKNDYLTELSANWQIRNQCLFSYPVWPPHCFKYHCFWRKKNSFNRFLLQLLFHHLVFILKKILNDLKNKTSSWGSSSRYDHQHPEFPHERGLKKQAAVVKQTWLLSPHCSLTFPAEGQKSCTTTCWASWCKSALPSTALYLQSFVKIGKILTLTSSVPTPITSCAWEAPWLHREFHYLSGLTDDRRSRKVIWMEITSAESPYLEDKQSYNRASVLLTQSGT